MEINKIKLSKVISYALRHAPGEYALELSIEGWASLATLVNNIKSKHPEFFQINRIDILNVLNSSSKKRFEIKKDQIRALYGHSFEMKIIKESSKPPPLLYHGTSLSYSKKIKMEGLKKMNRQYVHLAANIDDAIVIAKRKSKNIIVLTIDSKQAFDEGVCFYREKEIWLVDYVPKNYIS